jgi:hypothetical protein
MSADRYFKKLQHGHFENGRWKAGPNDLTDFPPSGRELIFRDCELEARFDLFDRAEREYGAGNIDGFGTLFHAEMYLKDRRAYELNPPPFKTAVPVEFVFPAETEAIQ